jgi:uncharacterized membrane protein
VEVFSLILHVSAAAILVGPQLVMFYAVIPSTWLVDDERLKRDILRVVATRFGMLAGISIVVLLVTGLYQYFTLVPQAIREDLANYRYGTIFVWKMVSFTVLVALVLVHTLVFARRINRLSDALLAGEGDEYDLYQARMRSLLFSLLIIAASFITLWLGVALAHHPFSYVPL